MNIPNDLTASYPPKRGRILICENYPGMRAAFDLMLGQHYELTFAEKPPEMLPLLRQHSVRLVIWDLDGEENSLGILREIRESQPDLEILLVSGDFSLNFQEAAISQCGLVSFLTKPWNSPQAVIEKIQVMLGDRKSSIRKWALRIPCTPTQEPACP